MRARLLRGAAFLLLGLALLSTAPAQAAKTDALKLYLDGKSEEARVATLAEIAVDPQNIEAHVVLCWSLLDLERWADAENYALKAYAIRRDPRVVEILGEASFMLGRNEASLRYFQSYVAALPEGTRVGIAYYHMGELYLRQARFSHADIALTAALQFAPSNARWWARLGWAREKANDAQGALRAYGEALRLDPRLEDALLGKERVAARAR